MKKVMFLFLTIFLAFNSFGQSREVVYSDPNDSLINYFIAYQPKGEAKGLLLLLPSFGETPHIASNETDIQNFANREGLITVFASLQYGFQSFYIDSLSQANLDQLIPYLQERYKVRNKPFYIGGFSLGGSGVIKYAERAYQHPELVKPKAIFAIDPPLDFEKMYTSVSYAAKYSQTDISKREAEYLINRLQYEFQCIPSINNLPYQMMSPFSISDTNQTNIKALLNCPIRLISEPAILWQMEERSRSLYDLNILDCSMAINALRLLGNKKAELILSEGKGYRKLSGKRNPHSWSIMDSEKTVQWLLTFKDE